MLNRYTPEDTLKIITAALTMAKLTREYYLALIDQGFHEAEALNLATNWQQVLLETSLRASQENKSDES